MSHRPRRTPALARSALLLAALALGGCAFIPAPPPAAPAPLPQPAPAAPSDLLGVLAYATSLRGAPYREGGESPETGFDCSGFVQHVYGRVGVPLPRRVEDMARALPSVAPHLRSPGDLVLFNTTGRPHSHVGIYLGQEDFVHAPSSRTGRVMVSSLRSSYWRARLDGIRRPLLPGAF